MFEETGINQEAEDSRLELILGPMTSGKTTEGMRRAKIREIYQKVLIVNTVEDNRYDKEGIVSHDLRKMKALRIKTLDELLLLSEYEEANCVIIEEGNFFPEIETFVRRQLRETTKTFIVIGLNGDKDEKLFGNIHLLIPLADKIDLLDAICKRCGNGRKATRTAPLIKFSGQKMVGGKDIFEAVCHKHYNEIQKELAILKSSIDGDSEIK